MNRFPASLVRGANSEAGFKHPQFVAESNLYASEAFEVAGTPGAKLFEHLILAFLDADIVSAVINFFCRKNPATSI
jgi:hypothetical protein